MASSPNLVISICLNIVYHCFYATSVGLIIWNRDPVATSLNYLLPGSLQKIFGIPWSIPPAPLPSWFQLGSVIVEQGSILEGGGEESGLSSFSRLSVGCLGMALVLH